jgi:hypothetical protein
MGPTFEKAARFVPRIIGFLARTDISSGNKIQAGRLLWKFWNVEAIWPWILVSADEKKSYRFGDTSVFFF